MAASKTVYQVDPNGFYKGTATAFSSPLEEDVWLLPANTVEEEPPTPGAGQVAWWSNGAWNLVDAPDPVPPFITPVQARWGARRLWNVTAEQQETFFLSISDEEERADVREAWDYALQIDRSNQFVNQVGVFLGKTASDIDDFFRQCAAYVP